MKKQVTDREIIILIRKGLGLKEIAYEVSLPVKEIRWRIAKIEKMVNTGGLK